MAFKVETTWKGIYVVSEESITNYRITGESASKGLLVSRHYDAVQGAIYLSYLLKEGKIKESVAGFYHTDEEMEKAYDLEKVLKGAIIFGGEFCPNIQNHNDSKCNTWICCA